MVNGSVVFFIVVIIAVSSLQYDDKYKHVEYLVKQWAPLIWLSPGEKYLPSSTDYFLRNVFVADENNNIVQNRFDIKNTNSTSRNLYFVTHKPLEKLKNDNNSFLYGYQPNKYTIPIYAIVIHCSPHISFRNTNKNNILNDITSIYRKNFDYLYFHVSYWMFYPYSDGKELCLLGKVPTFMIFNTCFGKIRKLGSHIGDWEHMSLSFLGKETPSKLYLAVHDSGVYYDYDEKRRLFLFEKRKGILEATTKYPRYVRMQAGHPVLFSANGSHGLWSSPGDHQIVPVTRLTDSTGYGVPWKTWKNVSIYHLGRSKLPDWMIYKGKWGNPKSNCLFFKKLGLCEYVDGPVGVLRPKQDFYCGAKYN